MDRLWFHQIILFSEPISLLQSTAKPISESPGYPSSSLSSPPFPDDEISSAMSLLPDEEISLASSPSSPMDEYSNNEDEGMIISQKGRSTRLHHIRNRNRNRNRNRSDSSSSPSPSTQSLTSKNLRKTGGVRRLQKSMSCKSLGELELEEVQGFMDLGFIFKKENLSPRMMSLVPGLQRLGVCKHKESTKLNDIDEAVKDDETETEQEEKQKGAVRRPYLSEAWFIRRSDSPLLNLRMSTRTSTDDDDMKKHIRFWARTVASVVCQES